jgi:hypothetical protein
LARTYIYTDKLPILTFDEIQNQYPKAKFIKVSASEFEEMKSQGELIVINRTNLILLYQDSKEVTPSPTNHSESSSSSLHLNPINFFPPCSGKDCIYLPVAIVVVIGLYAIVFLVADGLYLLGNVVFDKEHVKKWLELGATVSYFSYRTENSEIENSSIFGGLSISGGFIDEDKGIGFISEFGRLHLAINQESTDNKKLYGSYGIIGPTFRLLFNKGSFVHLDIMAGISDMDFVDVMGVARAGVNFKINRHSFIDVNYGLNYLELENMGERIDGTYNGTIGVNFGYRF